jgi:hypothetical protein
MSFQSWMETVAAATTSGTAVASSTTETILVSNVTLPANYLQNGRCLRLRAFGGYGTTGTPTLAFAIRWGGGTGASGTVMAKTGSIVTGSGVGGGASMTALWSLEALIQVRANGSSGTTMTNGEVTLFTTGTASGSGYPLASGTTGGTTPVVATIDLTADTALSLTALWGTNNAANSIQLHNYTIESLN